MNPATPSHCSPLTAHCSLLTAHCLPLTLVAAILLLGAPDRAAAQGPRTCIVVVDSTRGVGQYVDVGGGQSRLYASGGIWARCQGQATRWYSDSVAWYPEHDRFDMVGRVRFRDSDVTLTSDRASYFLRDERLDAHGNATLVNLETNSVLRGPAITYRRTVPGMRDTTELFAPGRPTVEYRSEGDPDEEPYMIVAAQVMMRGNHSATAWGRLTIDRSDFAARADSGTIDTEHGTGRLIGQARIVGGADSAYTLTGRIIDYRLEGRKLVWVQASEEGQAVSAEWQVVADTIEFDIRDDRIQRGTAWGKERRSEAISLRTTLVADSLSIDAPGQVLREVRGIGRAMAASRHDSLDTDTDWIAGDTVKAVFDPIENDRSELARVDAAGHARARYRVYPDNDRSLVPDLSYSRGDRIVARFVHERVHRVDVAGRTDGVYLEAQRPRQP